MKFLLLFGVLSILTGWTTLAHGEILQGKSDLLSLEKRVQEVVKVGQPATVALMDYKIGSSGTGVIVSPDGLVLTAAHVVDRSADMAVIMANGDMVRGKVLGANFSKDVAMVQLVGKERWPFVEMGSSDTMSVGDWVVVMGHAEGFNPGRTAPVRFGRLQGLRAGGYILSDCPMVGGDSGGPIFDIKGQVVGINSSIGKDLEYNNHAGISGLKKDFDRLRKGERWGRLVQIPNAHEDSAILGVRWNINDLKRQPIVFSVVKNSPAHKAGFQNGDEIMKVNDDQIKTREDVVMSLSAYRPGEVVSVTVKRGRGIKELKVKLGERGEISKLERK